MTNAQMFIAVGLPLLVILAGIILQQVQGSRIEARLTSIEGDLRQFYSTQGRHDEAIRALIDSSKAEGERTK